MGWIWAVTGATGPEAKPHRGIPRPNPRGKVIRATFRIMFGGVEKIEEAMDLYIDLVVDLLRRALELQLVVAAKFGVWGKLEKI